MDETISIAKKWKRLLTYTVWVYNYYHLKSSNELDIDIVDRIMLDSVKKTATQKEKIKLNHDQLLIFMVVLDYVNRKMLDDLESPFTSSEMKQFKESQQFMEKYNKTKDIYASWQTSKLEPICT